MLRWATIQLRTHVKKIGINSNSLLLPELLLPSEKYFGHFSKKGLGSPVDQYRFKISKNDNKAISGGVILVSMLLNLTRYLPSKRSLYSDSILKKTHTTAVTSSGVNEHNWTIWIFIHRRLLRLWYSQFSRLSQAINSKKQTYITQLTRCINTWPESTVRISGQHQKQSPEVFYKQRFS